MRASVTGSAVPMQGYSAGAGEKEEDPSGEYTNIIDVNDNQGGVTGDEGAGNTVTFGGVETNSYSVVGSTTDAGSTIGGGSTTGGMTEGLYIEKN